MNDLIVIIGADCDPDRNWFHMRNSQKLPYSWNGIKNGIIEIKDKLMKLNHSLGMNFKITWCVRADFQIKDIYGTAGWCLEEFSSLWKQLEYEEDEIGWHPHLSRWSKQFKRYYQEIKDNVWIESCLEEGFNKFKELRGKSPFSSRMGWVFHNNVTMKKLSSLGIKIDFSCIPGLVKKQIVSKYLIDFADWVDAPIYPYHPSLKSYKNKERNKGLSIWEIPCMPLKSKFVWLYNLREICKRKPTIVYSSVLPCTLMCPPVLFKKALKDWFLIHRLQKILFLVTYFHPYEIFSKRGKFFFQNLLLIEKYSKLFKREFISLTASELTSIL